MEFNLFDGIVIVISLLLAIKGFFRGIIKELAGLVGIIGGAFIASRYYDSVGIYINENIFQIPNKSAISLVGFVAVFMAIWVIVWIIGEMVSKMFEIARLGILDKLVGALFSFGKFFLLIAITISLLTQVEFLKEKLSSYEKDSLMYPIMLKIGNSIIKLKPEEVQKQIDEVKEKINKNIDKNVKQNIEDIKNKVTKEVSKEINKEINNSIKK